LQKRGKEEEEKEMEKNDRKGKGGVDATWGRLLLCVEWGEGPLILASTLNSDTIFLCHNCVPIDHLLSVA